MVLRPARFIHATAVVIEESGVLMRGASGNGKSSLAVLLLAEAERRGLFARLVGDDRVSVQAVDGQVVARPHEAIRGLIEVRMVGLVRVPSEPACIIRLVVDLVADQTAAVRLPSADESMAAIEEVSLPRLCLMSPPDALSCLRVFRKLFA